MGLFDLRCCLSGLSVHPRVRPKRFGTTMLLLEEVEGLWVPATPPVTGVYDRYGRIELYDRRAPDHADWVGATLELLWDEELLRSTYPDGLDHLRSLRHPAAIYLGHAADSVFNSFRLELEGARLRPCVFRADVGDAIADSPESAPTPEEAQLLAEPPTPASREAYATWLAAQGRTVEARMVRRWFARAEVGIFDGPPAESREILERFRRILRYASRHAPLRPFTLDDSGQHYDEDFARFSQEAWDRGDPVLRTLLDAWERGDRETEEARLALCDTALERGWSATPVTLALVGRVLRSWELPNHDDLLGAIERSPARAKILQILSAPRAQDAGGRFHELLETEGRLAATEALVAALASGLDLDSDNVEALVRPMFAHVAIVQAERRVSARTFDAWYDAGLLERHSIYAKELLSSYAAIAEHVDPSFEEILAAAERRAAALADDEDAFRLRISR